MALVARYHRRATPKKTHPGYRRLTPAERQTVRLLAALLRLAESLDRTHAQVVSAVQLTRRSDRWRLRVRTHGEAELELWAANRQKAPLERLLGAPIDIEEVPSPTQEPAATLPARGARSTVSRRPIDGRHADRTPSPARHGAASAATRPPVARHRRQSCPLRPALAGAKHDRIAAGCDRHFTPCHITNTPRGVVTAHARRCHPPSVAFPVQRPDQRVGGALYWPTSSSHVADGQRRRSRGAGRWNAACGPCVRVVGTDGTVPHLLAPDPRQAALPVRLTGFAFAYSKACETARVISHAEVPICSVSPSRGRMFGCGQVVDRRGLDGIQRVQGERTRSVSFLLPASAWMSRVLQGVTDARRKLQQ